MNGIVDKTMAASLRLRSDCEAAMDEILNDQYAKSDGMEIESGE